MKVALLTKDFPPAAGRVSTHVRGLAEGLKSLGVIVEVLVGFTDNRTLFSPAYMPLKEYDIFHVQSAPYGAFVTGVPFVVTVHAPITSEWSYYAGLQIRLPLSSRTSSLHC